MRRTRLLPMSRRGNNYHPPARNLSKGELGGVIFGCKNTTMGECLEKQLFGLPSSHFSYVKNIEPGLVLFLFNYSDRRMHGIYEATSPGTMNIDPYAWTADSKGKTGFPAQVRIHIRLQYKPITEKQFKEVLFGNYYKPQHFWFELTHAQIEGLIALFSASDPSPNDMIAPSAPSAANLLTISATIKSNLVTDFEGASSGAVEQKSLSPITPLRKIKKYKKRGSSGSNLTILDLQSLGVSPCQEAVSPSEPQFCAELLDREEEEEHMIEQLSIPSASCPLNTSVSYHLSYVPSDIIRGSRFPGKCSDSVDNEYTTTSDLCDGNAELVQMVKELKGRANTLEKKQLASELEIKQLSNFVNDSGVEIQQLKCSVAELESKLVRSMGAGNAIYLIGGFDGKSSLSALDSFSPSMDILLPLRPMKFARSYASAVTLNDNIYVFGGGDGRLWFNTVERYSQRNNHWSFCPPLIRSRGNLAGATLDNKIFALGGGDGSECFSDVEMLDTASDRWIYNQSMLQKRFAPAAAVLHDVLYVTGGFDGQSYLQTAERFDSRVGYWTKLPNMKTRRGCHSMAVLNEKLYMMGGFDGSSMTSSVETFDPRSGSWMECDSMNLVRGYAAAVMLGGCLFAIGGVDDCNGVIETVECYREGVGWATCNYKAIGKRSYFSAVVL